MQSDSQSAAAIAPTADRLRRLLQTPSFGTPVKLFNHSSNDSRDDGNGSSNNHVYFTL